MGAKGKKIPQGNSFAPAGVDPVPLGDPQDDLIWALWKRERELRFLRSEIERLKRELNFLKWAARDLLDYFETVPVGNEQVTYQAYRRKIMRLKGAL